MNNQEVRRSNTDHNQQIALRNTRDTYLLPKECCRVAKMEIILADKTEREQDVKKLSGIHFLLLQIYNFCFQLSVLEYSVLFFRFSTFSPIYFLPILQIHYLL